MWANRPAIPDITLPVDTPLDVLREGEWDEFRRVFGLPHASTLVQITATTEGGTPAELPGLMDGDRIPLTVLLTAHGADLKLVAHRLGRLSVMGCDTIRTVFSMDGFRAEEASRICLESGEDRGTLFVVESLNETGLMELSSELSKYLGVGDQQQNIRLYLALGEQLLVPLGVGKAALEEAEEALKRYVRTAEPDSSPALQASRGRTQGH